MGARKRRFATPATVPVESIYWHDASAVTRERLSAHLDPVLLCNTGVLVHENALEVVLSSSMECLDDWDTDNAEGFKIPRAMIVKRIRHGEIAIIPPEVAAYKERITDDPPAGPSDV